MASTGVPCYQAPNHPLPGPDDPVWLSEEQQRVWRSWLLGVARINEFLDERLRSVGLDLGDYEILVGLSEAENRERRMSELAEIVHQSRSRLTHAVNRMEQAGLVTRRAAADDRRGVLAQLTDKGFELLERTAPDHVRSVRQILVDAVDPDDYAALGRAMEAVLAVED